jgi:hypothetical protein
MNKLTMTYSPMSNRILETICNTSNIPLARLAIERLFPLLHHKSIDLAPLLFHNIIAGVERL